MDRTNPQSVSARADPLLAPCNLEQALGRWICWSLCTVMLALAPWVLYRGVFDQWWASDDLHHILYALQHAPAQYFFDAEVYRRFHPSFFAPWNIVGYDLDLFLFGPEPAAHYAHRLLSTGAVLIATFAVLRFWVGTGWALAGSLLFAVSGPTAAVATQLMNVHYLEGLLFALLSLACYVAAARRQRPGLAVVGALFYLLAMLAKEIYVPLILVLAALPGTPARQRASNLLPYAIGLAVYLVWRWSMLGTLAHGSGVADAGPALLTLPARIPGILVDAGVLGQTTLLALAASSLVIIHRTPTAWLVVAAWTMVLLAPLATIAYRIDAPERALVLCAWAFLAGATWTLSRLASLGRSGQVAALSILCVLGVSTAILGIDKRDDIYQRAAHFRAVGEFVMDHDEHTGLYLAREAYAARRAARLKQELALGSAPQIFSLGRFADPAIEDLDLFFYRPGTGRFEAISLDQIRLREARQERLAPLTVELWQTDAGTRWRFGPYPGRSYSVYIPARDLYMPQARPEGLVANGTPAMTFYVWYDSPDGWRTYSDPLTWRNEANERLLWERE